MPVDEGQEPKVPNGGQPIVEPRDEDLAGYGTYDPTEFLSPPDEEGQPQAPSRLYDENGKPLPSFDPRYAEAFEGLVFLGALTKEFDWLGHRFVIRTVGSDDLLAVAQVIKPWQGTMGEARAYTAAMVAMCVVSVDGQGLPTPVSAEGGEYAWAYQRFNYVKARWFEFTQDKVYSEYKALEAEAAAVVEAMEKASGPAASTAGSNAASAGPSDKDF